MAWFARLNRRIQLAACCDLSRERVDGFARRHRIPQTYTSYTEMLEHEPLDAVYLALPHHMHYEMLAGAIRAELPALVEKPITRTLDEGLRIVQQAQAQGVRVGVNYQYRYDSGCYALARAVQQGALGAIHYARCNVPWSRDSRYFQQAGWHAKLAQAGGGTLITQGSHLIDVLLWALNDSPRTVSGFTAQRKFRDVEVEDLVQATIELENGALLQICSSMAASSEQALSIEIYGEQGTALYSDRPLPHTQFRGIRVKRARPPQWGVHALQRSLEGFRAWVVDCQPYLVPALEALPALAVVEAIYRSAQSRQQEAVASYPIDAIHKKE
jgi:predicted dehydrogenase